MTIKHVIMPSRSFAVMPNGYCAEFAADPQTLVIQPRDVAGDLAVDEHGSSPMTNDYPRQSCGLTKVLSPDNY